MPPPLAFVPSVSLTFPHARSFTLSQTPSFLPPFRPRPCLPRRPRLRLRFTPRAHTHCGASHAPPPAPTTPPLLLALISLRQSARVAALGAILLLSAGALHAAALLPLLSRLLLYASVLLTGLPALLSTLSRLVQSPSSALDVDLLMTFAAAVSVLTGAVFEGALLTALYASSHSAEHAVQARARKALDVLRDAAPQTAWRLSHPDARDAAVQLPVADVRVADLLLVKAGELVPCDAVVAQGAAFFSLQFLTGESLPRSLREGDAVPAGARAEDAPVVVRVTSVGAESALARIARLVTSAQENKPAVTQFFDRFGRVYTRTVLLVSAALAVLLPVLSAALAPLVKPIAFTGKAGSVMRALGFLVAASPCALLIGAPVAYLAALSSCARKGVLTKSGAKSLEAASRASHVVFDKTGTLTTGKLKLTSATVLPKYLEGGGVRYSNASGNGVAATSGRERMLLDNLKELEHAEMTKVVGAAAALERGAVHPIATAVQKRAEQLGGELPAVIEPKVVAGQGVEGVLSFDDVDGGMEITSGRLGRPSYILGDSSAEEVKRMTLAATARGETMSVLELGSDRYLLRLKDEVRAESKEVVEGLQRQGLRTSVLTGDGEGAAQFVSVAVGGGVTVISSATPEQKLGYVSELGQQGCGVVMVGDGVNDAAALAASLVGISCGLSSATAVQAADVILVQENLHNVTWFLKKARATKAVVQQNLIIALGLMLIASGACVAGAVPLWLAVTLHEGGTVLVGLNGLRLLRER